MSGSPTRVGAARFWQDINQASAVSNITATATAGIEVPDGFRHEYAHLVATKLNTCALKVWGFANLGSTAGRWVEMAICNFTEQADESMLVRGVCAFKRLQVSINAIGAETNVNAYFGFSE